MSSFTVPGVVLNRIDPIEGSDFIEVCWVGGYQAVVQKGRFKENDVAVYVPEGAVVPECLLKETNFWDEEKGKGMLAGPLGDRVKAIRLRGVLSQGILIQPEILDNEIDEGVDYAHDLQITKYQPIIPAHLSGSVYDTGLGNFSYTDIENIKKYPDVLQEGEQVVMTEKLHGCCLVFHLDADGNFHVSSKGMAAKGLALEKNETNFYWRIAIEHDIEFMLKGYQSGMSTPLPITLFGEGLGVQDLKYGVNKGEAKARFFDIKIDGYYLSSKGLETTLDIWNLGQVPILYTGLYSQTVLEEYTTGKETLTGTESHIREGIVVRPTTERRDGELGRVILKSVSPQYLLRKGETTEYE